MHVSVDIWKSLAGIAIFLLGINFLEEGLTHLAGRSFKLFLKKQTTNNVKAVVGGAFVTGILQSSSIVNLMVLAFVGAGVIKMKNALGLILGANLGSTVTSWIIVTVGFSFNLEDLALPIAAISGIVMLAVKKESPWYYTCKMLLGFGFMFMGLSFIKTGIEHSIQQVDLGALNHQPAIVFLLIGFVITALIQSSAATVAITLSALNTDAISLFSATAIVLGAEAGTAIKLIVASVKGSPSKKRVAIGNLLFNIISAILIFLLLRPVNDLITGVIGIKDNLIALVFFQSLVNLVGIILFFPFLEPFGRFLEKRFSRSDAEGLFLSKISTADTELAMQAIEKETGNFIYHVLALAAGVFDSGYHVPAGILNRKFEKKSFMEKYEYIKILHGEIQQCATGLHNDSSTLQDAERLKQLVAAARNSMYAAKNVRDMAHDIEQLRNSSNDIKYNFYKESKAKMTAFCNHLGSIMLEGNSDKTLERLTDLYKETQNGYTQSLGDLYKEGISRHVNQSEISTLINFNREIYTAFKSLIFSIKDYVLDEKQAEHFDELPGFIR